jgi:hypothetical protein
MGLRPRAPRRAVCGGATSEASPAGRLRDRWHVNADASALPSEANYDVSPRIEGREAEPERRLLAG